MEELISQRSSYPESGEETWCPSPNRSATFKASRKTLLLGEKWEDEVKSFVKVQRDKGTVVNTATVMATARGVVVSHDANLLAENGGYIDISKSWATRFLERMNMVKRKGTTAVKILLTDSDRF